MSGCHVDIATSPRRGAPRSIKSVVMTIAGRSFSPRGVRLPIRVAHDKSEIEAPRMNQQTLEDICVAAQIRAAHPTGVVEMREGAFDLLASLTHQAPAARATKPPPIGIHQGTGGGLL